MRMRVNFCAGITALALLIAVVGPSAVQAGTQTFSAGVQHTYIKKQANQHSIVLDDEYRLLGGTIKDGRAPTIKLPFVLDGKKVKGNSVEMVIGSINGIHTPEAHRLGQAWEGHVSSPAVVKLNGKKVDYIYTNGSNVTVRLPRKHFRKNGINVVQIDAGYYFQNQTTLAYDSLSFQDVAVVY